MKILTVILGYLKWHYSKAIISLSSIWKNFLFFVYEFFSIKLLFKNLFDPWKRMSDSYPNSFNLKEYFNAFLTNLIMRVVGLILRTTILIVGTVCYLLMLIAYPITILLWLILPFIVLFLILIGIFLIIK